MSRLIIRLSTIALCAMSVSACTETEYLSHLFKNKGDSEYASSQRTYNNTTADGRPLQENGYKIGKPYNAMGQWYTPTESYSYDETGIASWYGPGFHGKRTANGEPYDAYAMTAAHPTLQLPCIARVTNLDNGRSVVVRVNDRGPFKRSRIMDVSKRAAEMLGMIGAGTAKVRVQVLDRESRIVAEAARKGLPPHVQMAMAFKRDPQTVEVASAGNIGSDEMLSVTQVEPAAAMPNTRVSQDNLDDLEQQLVRRYPVQKTSIYIQVGSFGDANNANRLASKVGSLGHAQVSPASVNGRTFNRVRIGPVATVDEADRLLAKTLKAGYPGARIVVD